MAHRRQLLYLVFPNKLRRVKRHRRPPEASRVHQCHIVLWVGQLTFDGALCVFDPFNHLDCVATFSFQSGPYQRRRSTSTLPRRPRRFSARQACEKQKLLHSKVADDGPDPLERAGGPTEENVAFASHQSGMWFFCRIGLWREFVHPAVTLFFFGVVPRLQPHLPLGFGGGAYELSGWCFVEACAVSCEHLTNRDPGNTHVFFRVCLMRRRDR